MNFDALVVATFESQLVLHVLTKPITARKIEARKFLSGRWAGPLTARAPPHCGVRGGGSYATDDDYLLKISFAFLCCIQGRVKTPSAVLPHRNGE